MSPIQHEMADFTAQVNSNKRMDLYNKDHLSRIKLLFPILLVGFLISLTVLFYFEILSQRSLILSGLISSVVLFSVHLFTKRACVASLKGDTLILRGVNNKPSVTSIKSIRKASSYRFVGVQMTILKYSLDKRSCSQLVFGTPSNMRTSLDHLLNHAIRLSKK